MKKRRQIVIIASAVFAVGCMLVWIYRTRNSESQTSAGAIQGNIASPSPAIAAPPLNVTTPIAVIPPSEAEITRRMEQRLETLYLTPISIYGKVIDQNGSPIKGATISVGVTDRPLASSAYQKTTDDVGLFSLTGIHGGAFSVSASKDGYYSTKESKGYRDVSIPGKNDRPPSTREQPIVLVLRKQGQTEPLIFTSSRQIEVPRTGQTITIDLATGRTGQGNLQVTSWIGDSNQGPFDWHYQLSIPNGGLIERKGQFDFEAPNEGYEATTDINMPPTAERWSSDVVKEYFAKLPDGRYARFSINFYPSQQRNFVVLESYINPTPGTRNLEFDPKRAIKPGS